VNVPFDWTFKRANGPVKTNVQKYRSYHQRLGGKSTIRKVDPATGNVTSVNAQYGNWISRVLRGSVMDSLVADTDQKRVDTDFANVAVERQYDRTFFDGSTGRGRLYGNDVNHDTMPWWCHDKVIIADLA
jgi:hypothetical protein